MSKKVDALPAMDKKLDMLVAMAQEGNEKLDQMLQFAAQQNKNAQKQGKKEKIEERRNTNMDKYDIKSADCKKEKEPFANGATAAVYRAIWERQLVAVKVVSLQSMALNQRKKITESFMSELDVLVTLRHPSVLCVYGVITDDPVCLQLVVEYAPGSITCRNSSTVICVRIFYHMRTDIYMPADILYSAQNVTYLTRIKTLSRNKAFARSSFRSNDNHLSP